MLPPNNCSVCSQAERSHESQSAGRLLTAQCYVNLKRAAAPSERQLPYGMKTSLGTSNRPGARFGGGVAPIPPPRTNKHSLKFPKQWEDVSPPYQVRQWRVGEEEVGGRDGTFRFSPPNPFKVRDGSLSSLSILESREREALAAVIFPA